MTGILSMDPAAELEPIRGIDLDRYARLSAEMLQRGVSGPEVVEDFVVARGVEPGSWTEVQDGWIERLHASDQLRDRYLDIVDQVRATVGDDPAGAAEP